MSETEEKEDTMTRTGGDRRVDQDCSPVGSARREEAVDVSEVEVRGLEWFCIFYRNFGFTCQMK